MNFRVQTLIIMVILLPSQIAFMFAKPMRVDFQEATGEKRPARINDLLTQALGEVAFSGWHANYDPTALHRQSLGWKQPVEAIPYISDALERLQILHARDLELGAITSETLALAAHKGFNFEIVYSVEVLDFVVFLFPMAGKEEAP